MAKRVWYTGTKTSMTVTATEWLQMAGVVASATTFDSSNGYSSLTSNFSSSQLNYLNSRSDFNISADDTDRPDQSSAANASSVPSAVQVLVDSGAGGNVASYFAPTLDGYFGTFLAPLDENGYFVLMYRGPDVDINYIQVSVTKASDGTNVGVMDYDAAQSLTEGAGIALAADAGDWATAGGTELAFDPVGFAPNALFLPAASPFALYLVSFEIVTA